MTRWILHHLNLFAGLFFVALGLVGAFLPLLPTTIFLIIAVGFFARSSPRLESYLLDHPRYGETLRLWHEHGAISRNGKIAALTGMVIGFVLFFWLGAPSWPIAALTLGGLAAAALFVLTRPSGPRTLPLFSEEKPMPRRIFVYGTLKRGHANHHYLAGARYLETARTVERFPLVIGGDWFTPFLIDEPGNGFQVEGEIFEITEAMLPALDRLESTHLPTGYRRKPVAVMTASGAESIDAYLKQRAHISRIIEGPLEAYPLDPRYVDPRLRG